MTDISADDELASLSEFTFLRENAAQAGATGPLPAVERIDPAAVSALKFGDAAPRVVFLHGGGQNAHTWDTVIIGLGEPALSIDLPGHGRSAWREDGDYGPKLNATAVEPVVRAFASEADLVVGMLLGGLTPLRLAVTAREPVRSLVAVDVTPSAPTSRRRRRWCAGPTRSSSTMTTPPNSPASHRDSRRCTSSRTPDTPYKAISR